MQMSVVNHLFRGGVRVAGRTVRRLRALVSGIAFWTGIVVPLTYLVFIIPGIRTSDQFVVFLGLVAVNYVALILGYPHNRSDA